MIQRSWLLSDSTVLDETWALTRASNKPLYAFALLWMSYYVSSGDSDTGRNTLFLHMLRLEIVCAYSVTQLCPTLCTSIDCSPPLSMGFSRQEYWSGFPCPPPGDLPDPGTEPTSLVSCISRHLLYQQRHLGTPSVHWQRINKVESSKFFESWKDVQDG